MHKRHDRRQKRRHKMIRCSQRMGPRAAGAAGGTAEARAMLGMDMAMRKSENDGETQKRSCTSARCVRLGDTGQR